MITRRTLFGMPAAAAVPGKRKRKPVGWSNQVVVTSLLLIEGTGDGAYVYNGPAALGNLIASIVAAAGLDPEGNVTESGISSYVTVSGVRYAVSLNQIGTAGLAGLSIQDTANPPSLPACSRPGKRRGQPAGRGAAQFGPRHRR